MRQNGTKFDEIYDFESLRQNFGLVLTLSILKDIKFNIALTYLK
jgi:hypothetical protein